MHAFLLVLTYDLSEDRRIDDVIIKTFLNSLLYKTNRFQVAVRLFSNRSQRTSKCGKNISDTLGCASCATFLFLSHFDIESSVSRIFRRALFVSFLKDFFDKFLYSLGISFQTLTPTREKAFFLHFQSRVLNAKEL